jgi:hypothetical protein
MAFIAGSDKHWLISLVENKLKELNTWGIFLLVFAF